MEYRIRDRRIRTSFRAFLSVAILATVVTFVHADTEQVIQYEYDNAGNITGISFGSQNGPPVITNFVPDVINPGDTFNFTAIGNNLLNLDISIENPLLTVSNVSSSETQVSFEITADIAAQQGLSFITFTNRFGSITDEIFVLEPFIVSINPTPILLSTDGQTQSFDLFFSRALNVDREFVFSISDPALAGVVIESVTALAGAQSVQVQLTGSSAGVTELNVASPELVNDQIALIVSAPFSGEGVNFTPALNVVVGEADAIPGVENPVLSDAVSISVGTENIVNIENLLLSKQVAISVGIEAVPNLNNLLVSSTLPIAVGPILQSISPNVLTQGGSVDFTVQGAELQTISSVRVQPSSGVTVDSFSVNPSGTILTISLTASGTAAISTRSLRIENANGEIPVSTGTRLQIEVQ